VSGKRLNVANLLASIGSPSPPPSSPPPPSPPLALKSMYVTVSAQAKPLAHGKTSETLLEARVHALTRA
jgi:hypothetical protein